jgi:hypothetical protein
VPSNQWYCETVIALNVREKPSLNKIERLSGLLKYRCSVYQYAPWQLVRSVLLRNRNDDLLKLIEIRLQWLIAIGNIVET